MKRRGGILEMTCHTSGGPLQWGLLPHGEFPEAFRDVGRDPENIPAGTSRLMAPRFDMDRVWRLMDGAIDVHIHPGPDAYNARVYVVVGGIHGGGQDRGL